MGNKYTQLQDLISSPSELHFKRILYGYFYAATLQLVKKDNGYTVLSMN